MSPNWKHPVVRWVLIGLAIVAIAAAGWFLIGRLFPSNPGGPTESERRSDSLAIMGMRHKYCAVGHRLTAGNRDPDGRCSRCRRVKGVKRMRAYRKRRRAAKS